MELPLRSVALLLIVTLFIMNSGCGRRPDPTPQQEAISSAVRYHANESPSGSQWREIIGEPPNSWLDVSEALIWTLEVEKWWYTLDPQGVAELHDARKLMLAAAAERAQELWKLRLGLTAGQTNGIDKNHHSEQAFTEAWMRVESLLRQAAVGHSLDYNKVAKTY